MSKLNFPFQIGEQYENWEFKLDILPDRINGYDSYKFIGNEFKLFLNFSPDETELIFNLDILECVVFIFKDRTEQFYEKLKNTVIKFRDIETVFQNNEIYIFIGNSDLINELKLSIY